MIFNLLAKKKNKVEKKLLTPSRSLHKQMTVISSTKHFIVQDSTKPHDVFSNGEMNSMFIFYRQDFLQLTDILLY